MRIIVAHTIYQQRGGEETVFESEVDLLRKNGHEVFTYVRRNDELTSIPAPIAAAETIWSREAARAIADLVKTTQAELVHFHNTFLRISPSAYYAAKERGAAVVQTLHNYRLLCPVATFVRDGKRCEDCVGKTPPWPSIIHACWRGSRVQTAIVASMLTTHRLLGTWTKKVDRFITLSEFSRQKFIQGGMQPEKIAVKPNFVSRTSREPTKPGNYALFAGRLSVEKGILQLLEAWKHIGTIPLKIVGDGPLRDNVIREITRFQQAEWLGYQVNKQVFQFMANAYLLVFPTIRPEGLGLSGLEALSVGLPVIAPRLGVMEVMIQDGVTGLLFEPNNPKDLAAKVKWAFDHPAEMQKMRKACLLAYEERWSPEKNYETLIKIYEQALLQAGQVHSHR